MAEFLDVTKQAKRMCDDQCACIACPAADQRGRCRLQAPEEEFVPADFDLNELPEIERIVMDWAAKNPELRYPSWKEWQDTNFPNNDALMRPCIFESEEYFGCKQEIGCEKCMNKPIPADIAEKLGIKPIGGVDDENI